MKRKMLPSQFCRHLVRISMGRLSNLPGFLGGTLLLRVDSGYMVPLFTDLGAVSEYDKANNAGDDATKDELDKSGNFNG